MMRTVLQANNRDVLREINSIRQSLEASRYPAELEGYSQWVLGFLKAQEQTVYDNLYYLSLPVDAILSEIMERTQSVTLNIRILSAKYISPLSRYHFSDNLSIRLLKWLHDQHPQSANKPFAVSDGNFSIYPSTSIPLLYYLPSSSHTSLLHLPLFFHEFGHYLFEFHRKENIDYIIKMQDGMEELLVPPYQQNDQRSHLQRMKAKQIIETWYDWIEEIFCDLVGLRIGGTAFLRTFSLYLRMSGRQAFYLTDKELEGSSHPVSLIRVKFLVERARIMGFCAEADAIEQEWQMLAAMMRTSSIYHGYYAPAYDALINEALDCMLEEANPINCVDYLNDSENFIRLLTDAWTMQAGQPDEYEEWEKKDRGIIRAKQYDGGHYFGVEGF